MGRVIGSSTSGQLWSNFESRDQRIGLNSALELCHRTGVTLDWIYRGQWSAEVPFDLAEKIRFAELPAIRPRPRPSDAPDPISAKEIGKRLTLLRTTLNITAAGMAAMIGVARTELWEKYEQGNRKMDPRHAARLCHAAGVTFEWIYRGDTARLPPELTEKLQQS
jgi:DNA-binding XRE family transcriptional regulator